jgi:hypothetical protein
MVKAGEIEIVGKVNTTEITKGMKRVERDFDKVSSKAKSSNSDFVRMGIVARKLSKTLIGLGTAGTAAFLAFAGKAPAVAPALASIGVQSGRLTRIAGEELKPAFDSASNAFEDFVNFVDENRETLNSFGESIGFLISKLKELKPIFGIVKLAIESTIDAGERFYNNIGNIGFEISSFIDKLKTALGLQTQFTGEGSVFFKPGERKEAIETSKRGATTEIPETGEVFEKGKVVSGRPSSVIGETRRTQTTPALGSPTTEESPQIGFRLVEGGVADRIRDFVTGIFKRQTRRSSGLALVDTV